MMTPEEKKQDTMQESLDMLSTHMKVVNEGLFKASDYDPEKSEDLEALAAFVSSKPSLSLIETEAIIDELKSLRK